MAFINLLSQEFLSEVENMETDSAGFTRQFFMGAY